MSFIFSHLKELKTMCKGICPRYQAKKPSGIGRYTSGQKRCNPCEIYINFAGGNCPCCGVKLRTKPRSLRYKEKYKIAQSKGLVVKYGVKMITA